MSDLEKEEIIKEITRITERHEVTAYEIAKNTGLSSVGVTKILKGDSKNPRIETLTVILNYLTKKDSNDNIIEQSISENIGGTNINFNKTGNIEVTSTNDGEYQKEIFEKNQIIKELKEENKRLREQVDKLISKL